MIARLTGLIAELKPSETIVDLNGVGYQVFIPFSTFEKLKTGDKVNLNIYTHHKEDQFKLFGFYTETEKELFQLLIKINGVGPSIALTIISGITYDNLVKAVNENKPEYLVKIPGIGKAKAEKLILELKSKIKKISIISSSIDTERNSKYDALEALVSLGYNEEKSEMVLDQIYSDNKDIKLEVAIKEALKKIASC